MALAACGGREQPALPPLVSGYGYLTSIRLNVAAVQILDPEPVAVRLDEPVPVRPDAEMLRMGQERLVAMGTEGAARFSIQTAEFRRTRSLGSGGLAGMFAGEPGERLSVLLRARLEILDPEGQRNAYVEAEARHTRTLPDGSSAAARRTGAEQAVRQAMEELNVEFEFQIRRALRDWLVEGPVPPAAPVGPGGIEREDMPRS